MKIRIAAGPLRHSIFVKYLASTGPDKMGAPSGTWASLFNVTAGSVTTPVALRAAILPLRGSQFLQAQELNSELDTKIRIRYHSGIAPKMRVYWTDPHTTLTRIFLIMAIQDPEMRHIFLDLVCKEVKQGAS